MMWPIISAISIVINVFLSLLLYHIHKSGPSQEHLIRENQRQLELLSKDVVKGGFLMAITRIDPDEVFIRRGAR